MDNEQILMLRAQANKAAHKVSRLQKLAERQGCQPTDPVAARRYEEYRNTRPVDRCDVSPGNGSYMRISCQVWAEIQRRLIASIFEQAAFYDGPGGPGDRVKRLQEVVDAAVADGTACAVDEAGWVPDVPVGVDAQDDT